MVSSPLLVPQGEDSEWPRGGCSPTNVPRGTWHPPPRKPEVLGPTPRKQPKSRHKLGRVPPRYVEGTDQVCIFPEPSLTDSIFFADMPTPRASDARVPWRYADTCKYAYYRAVLANSV